MMAGEDLLGPAANPVEEDLHDEEMEEMDFQSADEGQGDGIQAPLGSPDDPPSGLDGEGGSAT